MDPTDFATVVDVLAGEDVMPEEPA